MKSPLGTEAAAPQIRLGRLPLFFPKVIQAQRMQLERCPASVQKDSTAAGREPEEHNHCSGHTSALGKGASGAVELH